MTRRFTTEERRARLARRHLLAPSLRTDDVVAVADAVVALHSTDPVSVYLSSAARMVHPSIEASRDLASSTPMPASSMSARRNPPFSQKRSDSFCLRSPMVAKGAITISGGEKRRGCPASMTRRSVVPLRGAPRTNRGAGMPPRY